MFIVTLAILTLSFITSQHIVPDGLVFPLYWEDFPIDFGVCLLECVTIPLKREFRRSCTDAGKEDLAHSLHYSFFQRVSFCVSLLLRGVGFFRRHTPLKNIKAPIANHFWKSFLDIMLPFRLTWKMDADKDF